MNKKEIIPIFIAIILVVAGMFAYRGIKSKLDKNYTSLDKARENAYFARGISINADKLGSNTLLEFENLERLKLYLGESSKYRNDWSKLHLPPGLKSLDLQAPAHLNIQGLFDQVTGLESLKLLCIDTEQSLRNPPPPAFSLIKHGALRSLSISLCPYESMPEGLMNLSRLESLHIVSLKLKGLPAGFIRLRNLKTLEIRGHEQFQLPAELNKLKALEILKLDRVFLEAPVSKLKGLSHLRELLLHGIDKQRKVISLELKPGDFPALEKLSIWYYEINALGGVAHLGNLTDLSFKKVSLNHSQTSWSFPARLKMLELSDLGLYNAPPEIGSLRELRLLNLSDNCLSDLPPEFSKLKKLRWIDLSFTGILKYPKSLPKSPDLDYENDSYASYYRDFCKK